MKEIDLRSKSLGSYEYPDIEDPTTQPTGQTICLKDFTLFGKTTVRASYGESGHHYYEGHFIFEPFNFRSLADFREHSDVRKGGTSRALANAISCCEVNIYSSPPFHSIVAHDAPLGLDERKLKNIQDLNSSHEMYLMKAMVVEFLAGSLHVQPEIMACKITQDGRQHEYSFYFHTSEMIPFNINIKLVPDSGSGYLETISSDKKVTRYLI